MNSTDTKALNVLITGAAGGLGRALTFACARRGMQVLLLDRDLAGLEALCDEVEAAGGAAPGYSQVDLATVLPTQCEELLGSLADTYGPIDALVHCAAHFKGLQPMDQVAGDEWLRSMQVNLNAAWLLTATCMKQLRTRPDGVVIFTLDESRRPGSAYWGPYGASKAALKEMTCILADEMEDSNCRVYGINPGPMRTGLRATAYHAEDPMSQPGPQRAAEYMADLLLGKSSNTDILQDVPAA